METAYDGRQIVGMDLHRRRSVLARMTGDGRRFRTAGSPTARGSCARSSPGTTVRVCDLVVQPHFELDGLRWIDLVPIWGAAGSVVPRRAGTRRLAAKPMKARLSRGG
jgi:hypothetical protein